MRPGKTTAVFFLLAVIFRLLYIYLYPPGGTDHEMIHSAVDNLLSGNGLTFPIANTNDLSVKSYQPMTEWPPLVAYYISIVKAIVGNAQGADLIIMCLGMVLLLLVMHNIMKLLHITEQARAVLWIFIAANPSPFHNVGISDLYGALFMMWGTMFLLRFIQQHQISNAQLTIASLFFFLPAAFRYQYYPLVFIFPVLLIVAGKLKENQYLLKKGWLSLSIVFFLFCFQVTMLYQRSGTGSYIADDKTGFYPENLLHFYPFLIKAFINSGYFETKLLLTGGRQIMPVYYTLCAILTFNILFKTFTYLAVQLKRFDKKSEDPNEVLKLSRFFVFAIAMGVVMVLSAISLRYYPQISNSGGMFTYVKESRYFIVTSLLFLVLFTSLLQHYLLRFNLGSLLSFRKLAVASFFLINLSLFGKFIYNVSAGSLPNSIGKKSDNRQLVQYEMESLLDTYKLPIVAASQYKDLIYSPNIKDYRVIRNFKEFFEKGIQTSQPVQVVLVTKRNLSAEEKQIISQRNAQEVVNNKYIRMFHFIADNKNAIAMMY
jgi:hypothetical protein